MGGIQIFSFKFIEKLELSVINKYLTVKHSMHLFTQLSIYQLF